MFSFILFNVIAFGRMWYALPLVASVSLVYAATRHEDLSSIFRHAIRIAVWILGFMAVIFVVLWLVSRSL